MRLSPFFRYTSSMSVISLAASASREKVIVEGNCVSVSLEITVISPWASIVVERLKRIGMAIIAGRARNSMSNRLSRFTIPSP
jgi:hypothetical protein